MANYRSVLDENLYTYSKMFAHYICAFNSFITLLHNATQMFGMFFVLPN